MTKNRFPKVRGLWRAWAAPIAIASAILATPAQADVAESMSDFWNGIGLSNATGPSAYAGQSAGYYTGGNLFMRTPQRNSAVATVNLPSHRAGCGGIDFFAGGFSFINSDELVALMKSIGSNAVAYSFNLALETISPMIAEQIGTLQDWIQRINQFNINSCEAAKGIVGGLWPRNETASRVICEDLGNSSGVFTDRAAARHGCGSQGRRQSTLNRAGGAMRDQIPADINIAWEAAKKNPLFANDRDLAELMMNLAGTVVVLAPANDDAPPRFRYYGPKAGADQLIAALLGGGSATVNHCNDPEKCLSINTSGSLTVPAAGAFAERVRLVLQGIQDKIDTDTPLSAAEQALLNTTNIPIYKIVNVMTGYRGGLSSLSLPQYAELIALDVLYRYASDLMNEGEKGGSALALADDQILKDWRDGLQTARRALRRKMAAVSGNFARTVSIVESVRVLEQHLVGNMSAHMRANIGWVNGSE
ncbi:MAG: hypothetical protein GKS00_01865 [Alphaproteobacteria bacterium]|nr:hypothetical protein [Alphaproteobacteria bacterium]